MVIIFSRDRKKATGIMVAHAAEGLGEVKALMKALINV